MTETRFLARFATIANAAFNSMSANSTAVTAMSIGGHTINSTSMSAATNTFTVGTAAYFVANGDFYIGSNSAQGSAGLQVFGAGTRASIGFIQTSTATSGGSISGIDSRGFDGSNYFAGGTINFRAAENWSNTNHGTDIQFRTTPTGNGGALAESMRITANGNVGIGTSTPLARLDVVSSDRKRIRATGASEEGIILFQNGTTGTGTTNGFLVGIGGDSIAYLLNYHNSAMVFSTNGGERMRISADGNVGIGNTNPSDALAVYRATGAVYFRVESGVSNADTYTRWVNTGNAGAEFLVGLAGGGSNAYVWDRSAGRSIIFGTNNTQRALFDQNGHFLPGATNTYDLGSSSLRWRNIFTNDLNLSNGIGDYTIVEGEDDLFLYNNKKGKVYKFALIEVNPEEAPEKAQT